MPAAPTPTVLIVEDDPGIAELERGRLEEAGYRVLAAAGADDAMVVLGGSHIDLVLLDYRLPDQSDGLTFYERLKQAGFDVPVILVTGYPDEATVIRSLRAGVRDFVTKSVEYLDYLPEAVGRVLQQVGTERRLAESESRYRSLVETTNEWVWAADAAGRMTYSNPAAFGLLGYRPAELTGADCFALVHPDDRASLAEAFARGAAEQTGWAGRVWRWRHRDGSFRHLESNAVPVFNRRGEVSGFQGTDRDISERLRLEDQVRQAQKMEAVGRLAGGIAHDFNNLLTVINGYAELMLARLPAGAPDRELVTEMARAGERAAGLTQQLLAFSRRQILQPRVIDLNAHVRDAGRLIGRLIGADVALALDLADGPAHVRIDPSQAEQVLLNLCVNARDAMPRGGTLTVRTETLAARPPAAAADVPAVRCVRLTVSDTGTGMDAVTLAQAFDPFFTTKEVGKGTGLGLATVYGIVRQSGGWLAVTSEPGRGTTFAIDLPAADPTPEPTKSSPVKRMPAGTGTVLVVEDEETVRALVRHTLTGGGYTVLEAADGAQAVAVAAAHAGPIHLLLTDVVMPEMGGPEVAARLAETRLGLRVMYTSGYTDDDVLRYGVSEAEMAFLQKPFTPAVLLQKVREVLA